MTKNEFLNAYRTFALDAGFSAHSTAQYVSYLNNTCQKLPGVTDHLDYIAASTDPDVQAVYAEQMNAAITLALKTNTAAVTRKRLHDYKSAVNLLVAFLAGQAWVKSKGAVALPTLTSVSEYSRNDLRKIFLSRLKTQDRMSYSYGVFAARVLCKIATRHKVKLFNKAVDEAKFLYAPDKNSFFRLKEIDKLTIATDGHAYIERKGKTYPVYTETYQKGNAVAFEIANVTSVRFLSLDHDIPMYDALQAALGNMPEYKKLSDDILAYKAANPNMNASDLSTAYYDLLYPNLTVREDVLLAEIGAFLDATQLTVMHASYNSSKNKNTVPAAATSAPVISPAVPTKASAPAVKTPAAPSAKITIIYEED